MKFKVGDRIKINHEKMRENDFDYSSEILDIYGENMIFTITRVYEDSEVDVTPDGWTVLFEEIIPLGRIPEQLELFNEI